MSLAPGSDKASIYDQLVVTIKNVSAIAHEILTSDEFNETTQRLHLVDLGIGSIDYVEILGTLTDIYDVDMPLDYFANVNKISDVVDLIDQLVSEKK